MDLRVLGPLEAVEDGQLLPLGGMKQRTVLALLIAHGGKPVSTDALIDGVYCEDAPSGARRSVQTYVSNLRRQLGDVIRPTGSGYVLGVPDEAVDAVRFEGLIADAATLEDPAEASDRLREALAIWRGHPYDDVDGFGPIPSEVSRLNELRMVAVERRVDADLDDGKHAEIVAELESLTAAYPFRERFHGQHMLALYRSGRQAESLRAFEKARTYLVEEMGLDPSPELRTLEHQILEHDPALGYQPKPAIRRVAVLVADVDDPSALTDTDPGHRVQIVDRHSELTIRAIETHGGEVFAQRGTAIYSWFDSVAHAASAAEDAQWSLADVDDPGFRLRVAIDIGDVEQVGASGVQGPPVVRAAALLASARGGTVLLAAAAHAQLTSKGGDWQTRGLGTPHIDGLEAGLPVHLLLGGWPSNGNDPLRQTAILPAPPERGQGFPGYEWRDRVGSGVFGVVHRAYQPAVGREVAIKRIRRELSDDPAFIRRFEIEAQMVARLEHPHIVPLYDFWRDADGAFLVMRWMGGGSLADRLRSGPLGLAEASALLAQVGPALGAAHRKRVVHRDIRCENILRDEDGNWYLSDFGVAFIDASDNGTSADLSGLVRVLDEALGETDRVPEVALVIETGVSAGYADVAALLEAWDGAAGGVEGVLAAQLTEARNPYKGLAAFGELDADDFHGRDALTGQLVAAVAERNLVAVVGPSGIGKSSVVRAGLIPAVRNGALARSQEWLITDMVPTAYPFEQLASALERIATRAPADLEERLRKDERGLLRATQRYLAPAATLLLVIDQFEELFTLVPDEETRAAFLDVLAETAADPRSPVRIVLTVRADFFDRPLRYAEFGQLLRSGTIPASAPTDEELRQIIANPAARVGVGFEPGLVDRIIADVGDQPGTLPLLEFALTRLFDHRISDAMSSGDYDRVGGVLAALGRRAEQAYGELGDGGRDVARQVFMRLANVSEDGRPTRRRTRMTELAHLGFSSSEIHEVVDPLVQARLLTLDRDPVTRGPTVEVAHEALLSEWRRMADWIESQQEDLLLHSRLASAVTDWESSERAENYLLRAGRLEQHEAWTTDTELSLTSVENEFLELSRVAEDERRAQRRRVRRRVLAGFGAAAVLASVLAVAASAAQRRAEDQAALAVESELRALESAADADRQRELAEAEAEAAQDAERLARARELANAALVALDEDPELTILLALEAASLDLSSATAALHQGLFNQRSVRRFRLPNHAERGEIEGALSPDARWIAAGDANALHMFNVDDASAQPQWTFTSPMEGIELLVIGFDGASRQLAVVASWTSVETVPPAAAREQLGLYMLTHDDGSVASFHPYPAPEECYVFTVSQRPPSVDLSLPLALQVGSTASAPTAPRCAGNVYTWDLSDDTVTFVSAFPHVDSSPTAASMSADASFMALGGKANTIVNLASGAVVLEFPEYPENAVLNHDGSQLLAGFGRPGFADLVLIDTQTGDVLTKFQTENEVFTVGFMPDESRIFTAGFDSSIRIFTVEGAELTRLLGPTAFAKKVQVDASGERLASFSDASDIRVWDTGDIGYEVERLSLTSPRPLFNYRLGTYVGGDRLAVRHLGGTEVFDANTFESIHLHDDLEGQDAALSPDGRFMAGQIVLSRDVPLPPDLVVETGATVADVWGSVAILNADTGDVVRELPGLCDVWSWWATAQPTAFGECETGPGLPYPDFSSTIEWSPDGTMLVYEGRSNGYLIWDALTGDLVHEHHPPPNYRAWWLGAAFSPNSEYMVHGDKASDLGTFKMLVVDTTTWKTIAEVRMPGPWDVIEFTSDGSTMLVGFQDGFLRFYDTATWMETGAPIEAQGFIASVSLSADGRRAALGDGNGYFSVYDMETRGAIEEYRYGIRLQDVEYLSDDRRILLVPRYQSPFVISTDTSELVTLARPRLTRTYTADECATYELDPCPTLEEVRAGL